MNLELSILTKYTDFSLFGPETEVHRSSEVPERTEINIKATRDIESTSKGDQNHLKYVLCTLIVHFDQIYWF